ncbi:MAG: LysM peptidoglycan-binding domain-containing protein [Dehalococcoidia bacterium]
MAWLKLSVPWALLSLLVVVAAACNGDGETEGPQATGAPPLTRPEAVPTTTPWPSPPAPTFLEATPTAAPTPTAGEATYTVQRGDTLSAIAKRLGVDLQELIRVNNISDPNRLLVGQVLVLPGGQATATPAPQGATPTPAAGGTEECGDTYTVQPGDSPSRIAQKCGVDVNELMDLNGITDPRRLFVGQELQIPGR